MVKRTKMTHKLKHHSFKISEDHKHLSNQSQMFKTDQNKACYLNIRYWIQKAPRTRESYERLDIKLVLESHETITIFILTLCWILKLNHKNCLPCSLVYTWDNILGTENQNNVLGIRKVFFKIDQMTEITGSCRVSLV